MFNPPPIATRPSPSDLHHLTLRFLDLHEAPCPACGYNVHRVPEPRCPECGRALRLRLVAAGPVAPLPWVVLLITASLGAGIGLFVLAVIISEGMPHDLHWRVILTYFLGNIPLAVIVFALRRPLRRLEGITAWIPPLLMIAATVVMATCFAMSIRH